MADPVKHMNKVSGRRYFLITLSQREEGGEEERKIRTVCNFFTFTLLQTCKNVYQHFEYMDYL